MTIAAALYFPLIRRGRYVMPFGKDGRFAPLAAADTAKIIAAILASPEGQAGQAYQLHGPRELSHGELAAEVGRVLGIALHFKQVTASEFMVIMGMPGNTLLRRHSNRSPSTSTKAASPASTTSARRSSAAR